MKQIVRCGPQRMRGSAVSAGLLALCMSLSAHATLGGDAASVYKNQAALHATVSITRHADYTDFALQLPKGGVVHEFAGVGGQVFQVTWSQYGQHPSMAELLGDYAARQSVRPAGAAALSRRADRVDADFEVHAKVVNRNFSGSAHLPTALPVSMARPLALPLEGAK